MQTATPHIGDVQSGTPEEFTFHGEVPRECFGIFEDAILSRYRKREQILGTTARIIDQSVRDGCNWLERRIAAEENGVADAEPCIKTSAARRE